MSTSELMFDGIWFNPASACVCLCVWCVCVSSLYFLSDQDVGHQQGSDGGEGQANPGHPLRTGRSVAQIGAAAGLGHGVDGGVARGGEVDFLGLVALSHC